MSIIPFVHEVCLIPNKDNDNVTSPLCADLLNPLRSVQERLSAYNTRIGKGSRINFLIHLSMIPNVKFTKKIHKDLVLQAFVSSFFIKKTKNSYALLNEKRGHDRQQHGCNIRGTRKHLKNPTVNEVLTKACFLHV